MDDLSILSPSEPTSQSQPPFFPRCLQGHRAGQEAGGTRSRGDGPSRSRFGHPGCRPAAAGTEEGGWVAGIGRWGG